MAAIQRPSRPIQIPARSYHQHHAEGCAHFCIGYGCKEEEPCRKCRNKRANARMSQPANPTH